MAVCICMLMMSILVFTYLDSIQVISEKEEVSSIARKYILRMETVGSLTEADRVTLMQELENAGVTDISLQGTSMAPVPYGGTIVLKVRGKLKESIDFEETKVSTAKY